MDFSKWFEDLKADYTWYEPARLHHRPETFEKIAHKVYMSCVATGFKPMGECRRHVYNILLNTPHDNKKVDWSKQALEKVEAEQWKPASPEHVDKCVKEFNEMLAKAPMLQRHSGYKQLIEERGWDTSRHTYPITSPEEAYLKQRHLDWIKANFDARTGKPLPTWVPEDKWK